MGRKNKKKEIFVIKISKEKRLEAEKPRYNPYQGGTGGHKSKKDYTRKGKKDWKQYER